MTVTASTRVPGHARKVTAANTRQQGMFTIADSYTSRCGCGEYLGSHGTKASAERAHTEHKAAVVAGTFVSAAEQAEDPAVVAEREAKMAKWQAEEDKRNEAFARLIERQQARKAAEAEQAEPATTVETHRVGSGVYEVTKGDAVYDVSRDGSGAELAWYIEKRGVDGILSKAVSLDEAKRYIAAGSYDDVAPVGEEPSKAAKLAKRDEEIAQAEADGRKAYAEDRPSALMRSPVVLALIEDEPVGSGYARRIFQAWDEGYQAAADEAAAKALRDDEPAFPTELSQAALAALPEIVDRLRTLAASSVRKSFSISLNTAASVLEMELPAKPEVEATPAPTAQPTTKIEETMNRTPLRHKLLATAEEFQLTPGFGAKFGDFRRTDEAAEATGKPRWPSASECRTLRALWEENLLTRVPKVRAYATSPIKLTGKGKALLAEWNAAKGDPTTPAAPADAEESKGSGVDELKRLLTLDW